MKRKFSTLLIVALFSAASSSSCQWRFIWAIAAKINETDIKYVETCNLQKAWDSSDSLNWNSCLQKLIFIRYTIPMISGDFLARLNAITVGKGRGSEGKKVQFWALTKCIVLIYALGSVHEMFGVWIKGVPNWFRRRTFHEPDLIHWIKNMKSSAPKSTRNAFDSDAEHFMYRT